VCLRIVLPKVNSKGDHCPITQNSLWHLKKRLCAFSAELHYLVNEREAKARFEIKTRYLTYVMELS
jgi:hypothetical protein